LVQIGLIGQNAASLISTEERRDVTCSRTSAWLVAVAGLLAAGVLGFAGPAAATTGDSVTINNSTHLTVKTNQMLHVAASAQPTCVTTLGVAAPARPISLTLTNSASKSRTIASSSQPCDQSASLSATISPPAHNGAYTVTLDNGSPTNTTTATLDVLIPPAQVKGVHVSTAGTTATFTWKVDATADVRSYQILNSAGRVQKLAVSKRACGKSSGRCTTDLSMGQDAAGTTEKFRVRALRCGMSCSSKRLPGPPSKPVTASFAAVSSSASSPPPSATATPTEPPPAPPLTTPISTEPTTASSSAGGRHHGKGSPPPTPGSSIPPPSPATSSPPPPAVGQSAPPPSSARVVSGSNGGDSGSTPWRWIAAIVVLLMVVLHIGVFITRPDGR
jgi:hypothetical protein